MNSEVNYYRITVVPHSILNLWQNVILSICCCLCVFYWPYSLPVLVQSLLISSILLALLIWLFSFCYKFLSYQQSQNSHETHLHEQQNIEVFHLSDLGMIEWVKHGEQGQLSNKSYYWPHCFYLYIDNPLQRFCYWKVIYRDQLTDDSARRLQRIIKHMKSAALTE